MTSDLKFDEKTIQHQAPNPSLSLDELLDEALKETFPASDPVSLNQPRKVAARRPGA